MIDLNNSRNIFGISSIENEAGGEQYEMSFKIWQCHGKMLETACSRIAHIYRHRKKPVNTHLHYDFYHRVCMPFNDDLSIVDDLPIIQKN